jgi:peptidoglycan/LPS O-acetylase OafA/YrhL
MAEKAHLRPLDGLRGLAVTLVLLNHTFASFLGGIYGVDIFFVLSGFLITSLLINESARFGIIDYRAFYIRRALRLLPALILTLMGVAAIVVITGSNEHDTRYLVVALAVVFYAGNWLIASHGHLGYLAHTWSLGIEEQFYTVWPVILVLLLRRTRRPITVLLIGVLGVWTVRVAVAATLGGRQYPGTWTFLHCDGLLLGAAIAIAAQRQQLPTAMTRSRPDCSPDSSGRARIASYVSAVYRVLGSESGICPSTGLMPWAFDPGAPPPLGSVGRAGPSLLRGLPVSLPHLPVSAQRD